MALACVISVIGVLYMFYARADERSLVVGGRQQRRPGPTFVHLAAVPARDIARVMGTPMHRRGSFSCCSFLRCLHVEHGYFPPEGEFKTLNHAINGRGIEHDAAGRGRRRKPSTQAEFLDGDAVCCHALAATLIGKETGRRLFDYGWRKKKFNHNRN